MPLTILTTLLLKTLQWRTFLKMFQTLGLVCPGPSRSPDPKEVDPLDQYLVHHRHKELGKRCEAIIMGFGSDC